jgi:creatinine amidohydrolase
MLTNRKSVITPLCVAVCALALLAVVGSPGAPAQAAAAVPAPAAAAPLPVQWHELTASDFPQAVERAEGVCVVPLGVIEKHGPHLPLGTDVMVARATAVRAAEREYAVVFPYYFFGQINCAKHQPGCIAIEPELLSQLLQSVCDEIARNGFTKILLVNGHGGNDSWLGFFCQLQLAKPRGYAVYIAGGDMPEDIRKQIAAIKQTESDGHAGEYETSCVLAIRPDLVQLDRAGADDWRAQARLKELGDTYTGIWWYAEYPNHYAGDAAPATAKLGRLALEGRTRSLVDVLRAVKKDKASLELQEEFYRRAEDPLKP